jgi:EpsI family protein
MIMASGLAGALHPTKKIADTAPKVNLEAAIPKAFGDWVTDENVVPISPSPVQQEALNKTYDQIVSRTYVNSAGQRVMLSIAYGSSQTAQLRAHRQEVCYAAQGFQINALKTDQVSIAGVQVPLTRMVAVHGQRSEPVTYWFTMGDFVVRSYLDREVAKFKYALSGFIPDGYLFRVSSIDNDSAGAFAKQLQFANQLLAVISPELRHKLLGSV